MAGGVCCSSGLKNYGRGKCVTQIDSVVGIIALPTFTNSNVRNEIDLSAVFTQSTLTGKITQADPGQRWVKLPRLYAVSLPVADTVFDEASDGTKSFVREGIWSFSSEIRDKDAISGILKKLKALRCSEWSMFLVTRSNQLVGIGVSNGTEIDTMRPLTVNSGSIDPKMMLRSDSETNKTMFAFDFDNLMKQEDLYVLDGNDLGIDFLGMRQLTDVNVIKNGSVTSTTVEVDLKTDFVNGLTPNNDVVGLVAGDFVLENVTTSSTLTISSVVEDATVDGRYLITFTAQTAGDVLELSLDLTSFYNGSLEFVAV